MGACGMSCGMVRAGCQVGGDIVPPVKRAVTLPLQPLQHSYNTVTTVTRTVKHRHTSVTTPLQHPLQHRYTPLPTMQVRDKITRYTPLHTVTHNPLHTVTTPLQHRYNTRY